MNRLSSHWKYGFQLIDQAFYTGGSFLIVFLYARNASVEEFSRFSLLFFISTVIVQCLNALFIPALLYHLPGRTSHPRTRARLTSSWLTIQMLGFVMLLPLGLADRMWGTSMYGFAMWTACKVLSDSLRPVHIANHSNRALALLDALPPVLLLSFHGVVADVSLYDHAAYLDLLFLLNSLAIALSLLLHHQPFHLVGLRPAVITMRRLAGYGLPIFWSNAISWASTQCLMYSSSLLLEARDFAILSLCRSLSGVGNVFFQVIDNQGFAKLRSLYLQSGLPAMNGYARWMTMVSFILLFPVILAFIAIPDAILGFFHAEYASGGLLLRAFGLALISALVVKVVSVKLFVTSRQRVYQRIIFIGSTSSIILSFPAIYALGLHGCTVTILVQAVIQWALAWLVTRRVFAEATTP